MNEDLNINVDKIIKILKKSAISAYTDVACVSLVKGVESNKLLNAFMNNNEYTDDVVVTSIGKKTITILLNERLLNQAKKAFNDHIQDINIKTGGIFIKCPKEVIITPGVTAYLSSLFAENNVSIYEMISTYTDYVIILDEEETFKMASLLKKRWGVK